MQAGIILESLTLWRRGLPQLASRDVSILRLYDVAHVRGGQAEVDQLLDIEPDLDRVLAEAEVVDRAARQTT